MTWRDSLVAGAYRLGWAGLRALPERAAYGLFDRIADGLWRANGSGVRRLRSNYARLRPELPPAQLEPLVRAGMRAYLRYYCEAFRLPALSRPEIVERVRVVGDEPVRAHLAAGRPVVCFLGHMGNWDLAGAWCCLELGTVVTVAERLKPEAVFKEFLEFRTGLGMRIVPLTGGAEVFAALRAHAKEPVIIPLLADRDLTGGGLEVDLRGQPARAAVGPAALALSTGAALHPVSIRHERRGRGWGIVITFHEAVSAPAQGGTRVRAAAMTQACMDVLGAELAAHPADWHMLQRVFTADLERAR